MVSRTPCNSIILTLEYVKQRQKYSIILELQNKNDYFCKKGLK